MGAPLVLSLETFCCDGVACVSCNLLLTSSVEAFRPHQSANRIYENKLVEDIMTNPLADADCQHDVGKRWHTIVPHGVVSWQEAHDLINNREAQVHSHHCTTIWHGKLTPVYPFMVVSFS